MRKPVSEEHRKKNAEAQKRYWVGLSLEEKRKRVEHLTKISQIANQGCFCSDETKRKISEAHQGKVRGPHSESHRRKISEALQGKPQKSHTEEWKKQHSIKLKQWWDENSDEKKRRAEIARFNKLNWWMKINLEEKEEFLDRLSNGNLDYWERFTPEERREIMMSRGLASLSREVRERSAESLRRYWKGVSLEERGRRAKKMLIASQKANPSSIELLIHQLLTGLGIIFETQKPIGPYVVDIYLPNKNLIIECDGNYWHNLPGVQEKDKKRDLYLRKQGYKILRLWEDEIREISSLELVGRIDISR